VAKLRDNIGTTNRRVANLLSTARLYIDQVKHDLAKIDSMLVASAEEAHLQPDDENWEQRIFSPFQAPARQFPRRVADAINIFRFEKIGRWESGYWAYVQPPAYDRDACSIAEGRQDGRKQDALYVRVASDGAVASVPAATRAEVRREIGRADRFERCVLSVLDGEPWGFDDDAVREVFRKAFQTALA
jgi:hypothetical protein